MTDMQYNSTAYSYPTTEVQFGDKVKYYCHNGMKAEDDLAFTYAEATCNSGNVWTNLPIWKTCVESKCTIVQGYSYDQLIGWVDLDLGSSPGWWPIL